MPEKNPTLIQTPMTYTEAVARLASAHAAAETEAQLIEVRDVQWTAEITRFTPQQVARDVLAYRELGEHTLSIHEVLRSLETDRTAGKR